VAAERDDGDVEQVLPDAIWNLSALASHSESASPAAITLIMAPARPAARPPGMYSAPQETPNCFYQTALKYQRANVAAPLAATATDERVYSTAAAAAGLETDARRSAATSCSTVEQSHLQTVTVQRAATHGLCSTYRRCCMPSVLIGLVSSLDRQTDRQPAAAAVVA